MSALSEHLPLLASAPDGVDKLRSLILELALRGKLLPQDPNDEPASVLLERIAQARARLEAQGKVKKSRLTPSNGSESLYALPNSWSWSPLDSLIRVMDSGWSPACMETPSQSDEVWGVLKTTAVQSLRYLELENKELPSHLTPRPECEVASGDILVTRAGPKNRVAISCLVETTRPHLMISDKIIRFHLVESGMDEKYVALCLNAGATAAHLEASKSGMATSQMNITQEKLRIAPIPICSTAEQRRIVARVDELMTLCDRLEAEQAGAESAQAKLVETLLGTLARSIDATDFAANWKRLEEHFDTLFTTEPSLDTLKQTIWQLAVTGKLVSQDSGDEAGSELLKRIRFERASASVLSRSKANKSSVIKPLKALPNNWEWAQLADLAETGPSNGYSPKPCSHETRFRCLTLSATTRGYFKPDCFKYVDITEDIAERFFLKQGDLLIQRGNSIEYVGMAALYDHADDEFIYPDLMMRIRLTKHCNARFIHTWLISKDARNYFMKSATGTQGTMPKVNQGVVSNTPVPFPPLAEQHRIVAKVDELITLCDRLKAGLAESRTQQDRLALALIESALKAA